MSSAMRTRAAFAPFLSLALIAGAGGACFLPGPEALTRGTDVELVLTGLIVGDRIDVRVDGASFVEHAKSSEVRLFLALPLGHHNARAVLTRGSIALCAAAAIDVGGAHLVRSIDFTAAAVCTPDTSQRDAGPADAGGNDDAGVTDAGAADAGPADAGAGDAGAPDAGVDDAGAADAGFLARHLVRVEEDVTSTTCGGPCPTTSTIVDANRVITTDGSNSGDISDADFNALEAEMLGADVDALFAGDDATCPVASPPAGSDQVVLKRRTDDDAGNVVDQQVDATGCSGGAAGALRARLAFLRQLAFGQSGP